MDCIRAKYRELLLYEKEVFDVLGKNIKAKLSIYAKIEQFMK